MQIAKELNYAYGYILGSAFGGNCTVMLILSHRHLMPWSPCSQSPGRAGRVSSWQLPQPYQPRLKLCCKLSFCTHGRSDALKKCEWYGRGFPCPLLALWQLTPSSAPSLAWSVMWHPITTSNNPMRAYLLKAEGQTKSQSDRPWVTCPRAAALEHGSSVTLQPCAASWVELFRLWRSQTCLMTPPDPAHPPPPREGVSRRT